MKRIIVPINVASRYLEIADVLSYRLGSFASAPRGWLPCRLIEIAGRNPDVHTAVIDQDATHEWMVLGMRLGAQKLKLLSDEVRDNPGLIDVYRYLPLGEFDGDTPLESGTLPWTARRDICNQMRLFALRDRYGVANVIRAGLHLAAITRLFAPIESADRANSTRPYCSQAVAISYAERGYPLLNNRRPSETLPGDLVTSKKLELLCTLGPEVAEPEPLENYYDPKRHVEPVKPASWKFSIRGFWTGLGRPMPALATDH